MQLRTRRHRRRPTDDPIDTFIYGFRDPDIVHAKHIVSGRGARSHRQTCARP